MRPLMILATAVLLAGCSTPIVDKQPVAAAPPVAPPPLPAPEAAMQRQSVRAFSVLSSSVSASDTTSTNYSTATKFAVTNEFGQKSIGVRVKWPNWPTNTPYSIQRSTNLVDWDGAFILSSGDAGAALEVIDQAHVEFYRIVSP